MRNTEIEAGNKLIAEFMNLKAHEWDFDGTAMKIWVDKDTELTFHDEPELWYHSSWDWLIPVVEKIEGIYDEFHGYFAVSICSNSCSIQGTKLRTNPENFHPAYMSDPNSILETKIQSTWYNVVQFIQWYNQNKHP